MTDKNKPCSKDGSDCVCYCGSLMTDHTVYGSCAGPIAMCCTPVGKDGERVRGFNLLGEEARESLAKKLGINLSEESGDDTAP
jgi:hypothetical protein